MGRFFIVQVSQFLTGVDNVAPACQLALFSRYLHKRREILRIATRRLHFPAAAIGALLDKSREGFIL